MLLSTSLEIVTQKFDRFAIHDAPKDVALVVQTRIVWYCIQRDGSPAFEIVGAEDDTVDTCQYGRTGTHGARFKRRIEGRTD